MKIFFDLYHRVATADEALLLRGVQIFVGLALVFYLAPYLVLGSESHWMIWDNLDSNYVAYKVLLESGSLFAPNSTIIPQLLGGVPRGTMPSEFDAFVWLYVLFGPEGAYIVNRVLMTLIGFVGMYLLLRHHFLREKGDEIVRLGVALCFALLPFWPFGGLSVAGMPLAFYAMLQIRQGQLFWWNWLIVALYPFYSSLVLSGVFFLVFVTCIWITDLARRKSVWPLFSALALMSIFYVFTHYRLFIDFFLATDYISHRIEFGSASQASDGLKEAIKNTLSIFVSGQPHAHSLQRLIIFPLLAVSALLMLPRSKCDSSRWIFWLIIFAIGAIALFHGFQSYPPIKGLLSPIKTILPMQLDRFYFLYPIFWAVAFGLVLSVLSRQSKSLMLVVIVAISLQTAYAFRHHELLVNRWTPSVGEFFALEQFSEIKSHIGEPVDSYRVASIGIHPSVALFNGFYTLDGYWGNYPLPYKHAFRRIIADELEKDIGLKQYFDNWGSRVYLFNAKTKTNMVVAAGMQEELTNLDFNWRAFYELGGRYVISAVEIDITEQPELLFEGTFKHPGSAWNIHLYRVQLQ